MNRFRPTIVSLKKLGGSKEFFHIRFGTQQLLQNNTLGFNDLILLEIHPGQIPTQLVGRRILLDGPLKENNGAGKAKRLLQIIGQVMY